MLVKISSDGNNKIHQQSIMEERDCIRIAKDANIQFEYIIDIFYNPYFEFDGYKSNLDAAKRLEVFYPNPSVGFKFKQRIQNMFFPSSSWKFCITMYFSFLLKLKFQLEYLHFSKTDISFFIKNVFFNLSENVNMYKCWFIVQ